MMRSVPVDIPTFLGNVIAPVGFDPKVDFDTGEHLRSRDGVPLWRLTVLYQEDVRFKKELVEIGFAAVDPPDAGPGAELALPGILVARHWENTNKRGDFRSGLSLTADEIALRPPARPERAA